MSAGKRSGIAVAGSILVDHICEIAAYPAEGELTQIRNIKMTVGGLVPNNGIGLKKVAPTLPIFAIGKIGADGTLGRGMQWQGMSLWMTLRHGPTPWITSSYIPTLAGRLFFLKDLAGPLVAECN